MTGEMGLENWTRELGPESWESWDQELVPESWDRELGPESWDQELGPGSWERRVWDRKLVPEIGHLCPREPIRSSPLLDSREMMQFPPMQMSDNRVGQLYKWFPIFEDSPVITTKPQGMELLKDAGFPDTDVDKVISEWESAVKAHKGIRQRHNAATNTNNAVTLCHGHPSCSYLV